MLKTINSVFQRSQPGQVARRPDQGARGGLCQGRRAVPAEEVARPRGPLAGAPEREALPGTAGLRGVDCSSGLGGLRGQDDPPQSGHAARHPALPPAAGAVTLVVESESGLDLDRF